jgi:integrase
MTATVQTKKDRPNYYILVRYQDEKTGKERQKWVTTDIPIKGNNKRKAEERREEVLAEYKRQRVDLSKDALFTVFMEQWLENLKFSIAPTTYDGYYYILKSQIFPYFEPKKIKVKDLTPAHLQQYISFKIKTISPNTIIKHFRNISKCLDSAVRQNIIAFNPAKRIELPKKVKYTGAKHYNEKQIEQLLECSKGDPLEIVILLTVFYGLRRSEVLGLKWKSVDFENNTITIQHTVTETNYRTYRTDATKNDSSYAVIPLPKKISQELKKWEKTQLHHKILQPNDYCSNGYICTNVNGELIKPNYVTQHFKLLLEKNDLPLIRFHDLRHSAACYLKYLGFDFKDIQTWLRHGDIQTTMNIYVNLDMEAKAEIANKLDDRFSLFSV